MKSVQVLNINGERLLLALVPIVISVIQHNDKMSNCDDVF